MIIIPSVDIGILPCETYITSPTNPYMVVSIYNAGALKPYLCNLYQYRHHIELKFGRLKTSPCCECYALDLRVAEDEKLMGSWIFNKFDYYGGVVVVV